ncbi:homeobox-leucine zipper protein REVOLUTA-like isoform X2 [Sesamum indicum]|uniref:Homeobox-leucine zipper protein REVOLUTA-like isoform X2 n=1 Tax=Sesamum indicum TaxID=4182 RepID=A0A6I9T0X3_SESIN|nr:homeobox-leucine zipper protein REVOLUTA-like isoform X2 [Sesamum indicum]
MAITENAVGETSKRVKGAKSGHEQGSKYTRYTEAQIEVLEKVYAECSNPNYFQRSKILREQPNLRGIDSKQLKVWFQNHRSREKQKKENGELLAENKKLAAANELLREENDCLQQKVAQLICENEYLQTQFLSLISRNKATTKTTDLGLAARANSPQLPLWSADNNSLLVLAEEIREEFLCKATGTAVNWKAILTVKLPSPSSVGAIYVSDTCIGVAARACTIIPIEPVKIIEILKDRASWSRNCRNVDVLAEYPAGNGGAIELIYTQYYAPTTMACARDFWTLRYTSVSVDGSFVVCEKSVSGSDAVPSSPAVLEFVRGRMLASGYLIHPCEGGSIIHLIDHLDLEASSVPEVVRPLYESSELVAKNMIVPALEYIEHTASETHDKRSHAYGEGPAFLRSFSQRLSRGFNDAITGFTEDGWTLLDADAPGDIIVSVKRLKNFEDNRNYDSVICMKASLLLQVLPAKLMMLLKERRSCWMNINLADHSAVFLGPACFAFPGSRTYNLSGTGVLLGHTNYEDEILEVLRFDRIAHPQHNVSSGDLYHLQICNGMEDSGVGACSELIFAPIDRTITNDAVLLSSGFRIISLPSNAGLQSSANMNSTGPSNATNVGTAASKPSSVLILAFQFPFETHLQDKVASIARKYVQHVISYVKNISLEAMPSGSNPETASNKSDPATRLMIAPDSTYAATLANLICQSYRSNLGVEIFGCNCPSTDSLLELIRHHQYAILCFAFTSLPVCLYANQAGLDLLETTANNLLSLTVDRILGGSNNFSLSSILPTIMQQGYAILPPGYCISEMNRRVSYEQAVVWQVQGSDGSVPCLALAFMNWSFT